MKTRNVDIAIIGTGTAGMSAYREARKNTDSIALIEGGSYGTTCARVGCMPSKLLIAAAEAAHHARHTHDFGVKTSGVEIDGNAVMRRVQSERDRFVGFVEETVEQFDEHHRIRGYAKFVDDHRLLIDDKLEIYAKRIVIATGSRPNVPPLLEKAGDRLLVNDDVFELASIPKSVAVFGPGVIGLELGQALSRLGSEVKVFGRGGGLAGIRDEQIREYAQKTLNEEFYLDTNAHVSNVIEHEDYVEIEYHHRDNGRITEKFDYLLAATGRTPNVDKLSLENTGLVLDERGVPIFSRETLQTSVAHIFIAGDVNNDAPLLHEAADEGKIAGQNAGTYPRVDRGLRRSAIGIVFTDPQVAFVGNIDTASQDSTVAVGQVSFENQGRSRVMLRNKGILKVYGDVESGKFIGAEMFGPAAEHIAHLLSWSVQQNLTVEEMLAMPFYHPVIEEGVRTALRDLNSKIQEHLKLRVA